HGLQPAAPLHVHRAQQLGHVLLVEVLAHARPLRGAEVRVHLQEGIGDRLWPGQLLATLGRMSLSRRKARLFENRKSYFMCVFAGRSANTRRTTLMLPESVTSCRPMASSSPKYFFAAVSLMATDPPSRKAVAGSPAMIRCGSTSNTCGSTKKLFSQ